MPVTGLDDIGAFGACGGTGASLSGDVALTRGEGLRVVGHDGFEDDAAFAGSGGQRQRVRGRRGERGGPRPAGARAIRARK